MTRGLCYSNNGDTSGDKTGDARKSVADDQNAGANWNDSFLRTSGIVTLYITEFCVYMMAIKYLFLFTQINN